jgi:predicted nucleic acid-binding protein
LTLFAVDASVVVKWLTPEIQSDFAVRLLQPEHTLIAPDLLPIEIANTMWKHVRRREATPEQAQERLARIDEHVVLFSLRGLSAEALTLALQHGVSAYDGLYAALSIREECQLVTADRRFYDALVGVMPEIMVWIEDVPKAATG